MGMPTNPPPPSKPTEFEVEPGSKMAEYLGLTEAPMEMLTPEWLSYAESLAKDLDTRGEVASAGLVRRLLAENQALRFRVEELTHAGRGLLSLIDDVPIDPALGDETDRVFPRYEFEPLRMAIEKATQMEPTDEEAAPQSFPIDDEYRRQSLLMFREMWIDTPAGNDSRRKALEAAMCVFTFGLPSHDWIGKEAGIEWDNACLCDSCSECGD